MALMKRIEYKCSKCCETDHGKFFENETPAPAINCFNCHAGMRMELSDMLQQQKGMFLTGNVEQYDTARC